MLRWQVKAAKSETRSHNRTRFDQAKEGEWKKGWESGFRRGGGADPFIIGEFQMQRHSQNNLQRAQ